MARSAKLKVYRAPMGFYETIVAAPSQKAALAAWGTRQNLFQEGQASLSDEPSEIEAAYAQPGTVLRRVAGTREPFRPAAEPVAVAALKAPARVVRRTTDRRAASPAPSAPSAQSPRPTPPDRSRLTAAENLLAELEAERGRRLEAFEGQRRALEADFERRRQALEARTQEAEASLDARLRPAEAELDEARRAFRKAGGRGA